MHARGRFITIEGGDGAGKSSSLAYLRELALQLGAEPVLTREPGGTALGEAVRELLLDSRYTGMANDTELLLMFAARAEHLAQVVRPALVAGAWVICDRFTDATYAYQGAGRGIAQDRISVLEDFTQGILRPDLTLLLDVPVAVGLSRAGHRSEPDRIELERRDFFERVRAGYLDRAQADPQRVRVVDASQPVERVRERLEEELRAAAQRWEAA